MMMYQLLRYNLYEYLKLRDLEDPFSCGVHTLKEACLAMGRKMTVS
jgi:rRNA maturation protein Nop10